MSLYWFHGLEEMYVLVGLEAALMVGSEVYISIMTVHIGGPKLPVQSSRVPQLVR